MRGLLTPPTTHTGSMQYMPTVRTAVFFGGVPIKENEKMLKENPPVSKSLPAAGPVSDPSPDQPNCFANRPSPLTPHPSYPSQQHIVVGTPGRMLALTRGTNAALKLNNVKHFVLDECDKMLEELGSSHFRRPFPLSIPPSHSPPPTPPLPHIQQTCALTCRRSSASARTRSRS